MLLLVLTDFWTMNEHIRGESSEEARWEVASYRKIWREVAQLLNCLKF